MTRKGLVLWLGCFFANSTQVMIKKEWPVAAKVKNTNISIKDGELGNISYGSRVGVVNLPVHQMAGTVTETSMPRVGNSSVTDIVTGNPPIIEKTVENSSITEKCYIINTPLIVSSNSENLLQSAANQKNGVKFVYNKNIQGFSFCASQETTLKILKRIVGRPSSINIEEDKIYRIGEPDTERGIDQSHRLDKTHRSHKSHRLDRSQRSHRLDRSDRSDRSSSKEELTVIPGENSKIEQKIIQSDPPEHFFRIINTGNLVFNNYFLDNPIFYFLGISRLIRYFYKYEYSFDGKGVKITVIDTPPCHSNRLVSRALLNDIDDSLSKGSKPKFIEVLECDGSIRLSKLLHVLETLEEVDILVLPIYGPSSEALDAALKHLVKKMTVISSAGDDGEDGCNYSPNGRGIIKVGSATKHGQISEFSNQGTCVNLYSLGEDILGRNGTGHSVLFVAGAVALYKEKDPLASHHKILQYLLYNTLKNEYGASIFKIPYLPVSGTGKVKRKYYALWKVLLFCAFCMISKVLLTAAILILIRRLRRRNADQAYFSDSLRKKSPMAFSSKGKGG